MDTTYIRHRYDTSLGILGVFLLLPLLLKAQKEDIKPDIQPAIFTYKTEITITYDVTGTSLANLSNAWIWVWIPGSNIDAKYNINPASDNTALTDNAKFTKNASNNKTTFSITFVPQDFFVQDISKEKQIGVLLKGNDWSNGQTTDYIANFAADKFSGLLLKPESLPVFVNTNDVLPVEAVASDTADFSLSINGNVVDVKNNIKDYSYQHVVTETSGRIPCSLIISNAATAEDTTINFSYLLRTPTVSKPRPPGIISGINYDENDPTRVTLCLLAPMKNSVFVLGDFNNFTIDPAYQMYRDGEYFWLEIDGLTPQQEYAFQYLVDEQIYVADPYADKILDPDDKWIPASIYPGLKPYPQKALHSKWYFNRLAIIQTGQVSYSWKYDNYSRPEKESLIVYKLLVRDFFDENNRSYDNLIDTLSYFKSLGVNAIELMPVMEFQGNSSWGYNPTFMFAPDKAYGTKNKLKEFIDFAHSYEIAVILDIVLNHQDVPNPYAAMYFDFTGGVFRPTADNPWFNVQATHPYSVFYDLNHESLYTQHYVDTTLNYWFNQYHVDGFRFDLSKGFTQTVSGSDVGKWSQKDLSRIALIERMIDKAWSYAPGALMILEHFADNSEEKLLADHGLMLWGNQHSAYKETILGYHDNNKSDLAWGYAPERGWQDLNLVTYMESHDEERQMYNALQYGNSEGDYSVRDKNTALNRIKAASAFLYLMPGPKMLWQFGELGYDVSIEENGRTGEKPVRWGYYNEPGRKKLYDVISELIRLRNLAGIDTTANFFWEPRGEVKRITTGSAEMKIVVIGNFGVSPKMIPANFPAGGVWYDYFTGVSFDITDTGRELFFAPGEFHIYTTEKVEGVPPELVPWGANFIITGLPDGFIEDLMIFPNPVKNMLKIHGLEPGEYHLIINDLNGRKLMDNFVTSGDIMETSVGNLPEGIYLINLESKSRKYSFKFIKTD